jgi:phosphoglycolate phosphatase
LNAGCASVGVSYGAHAPAAFHVLNPLFVAHSVASLHQWLLVEA